MSYNYLLGLCRPSADKAHAQAQGRHAQRSAGHLRTRGPRKHHTLSQARGICQHKQTGKHTNEGKVRAGRCRVRTNRKDMMQCKHPGKAPDVSLSLFLGVTGQQRNATHDIGGSCVTRYCQPDH